LEKGTRRTTWTDQGKKQKGVSMRPIGEKNSRKRPELGEKKGSVGEEKNKGPGVSGEKLKSKKRTKN